MNMHDLIFTKKWPQKLYRHIGFWIGQMLFWLYWAVGFAGAFNTNYIFEKFRYSNYFIPHMLYTYFLVYVLAPEFFDKKKYGRFALWVLAATFICYIISAILYYLMIDIHHASTGKQLLSLWYFSTAFIFNGPPAICAMFITFKILKNYFLKIREYRMLTKENARAELQLLNAEIQPHFLFNTLNTIYSFTLDKSPKTGGLVIKLKDTIGYMVYECDAQQVSLDKEIKMIRDYVGLEKIRYGNRVNITISIEGDYTGKMIAPLLMIPFVENCFKHGVGKTIGSAWIDCSIKISEDKLDFSISNNNGIETRATDKSGIGLTNVKRRLELLYSGQYVLNINHGSENFTVQMQVPIHPAKYLKEQTNELYASI